MASTTSTVDEILEAVDRLAVDDQDALLDAVRRRIAERRREQLVEDVLESRRDFQEGRCRRGSVDDIMNEVLA